MWFGALCHVSCAFLGGCNACPGAFLLALLACEETGCVLETAGCWKNFVFSIDYAEGARNGHPFLRKSRISISLPPPCQTTSRSTPSN